MNTIKIQYLANFTGEKPLRKQTNGSAGYDLYASMQNPVILFPGYSRLIPTGIILDIPKGMEGQIRPRSGLALRHGITVLNSPGTIDSDYREEIGVILINLGRQAFEIQPGMRIAQIVFATLSQVEIREEMISDPGTRKGGFGSTGI